jgi:hypothetical protein
MATVPDKRLARVQYYENHIAPFTSNATAIGISSSECTDLQAKTEAARTAYNDQQAAQQASKVATEAYYNAVAAMTVLGAGLIAKIRAMAETTGNPNVYTLAEIPAPPVPTPVGPLGMPTDFRVKLTLATGAIDTTWKCSNPRGASGTVYQIWRRIGSTGEFTYLGGAGDKKYTDSTVPAGTAQVQYQIQAVRSTSVGPYALFIVNFGAGDSASVIEGSPTKIAA